MEAAAYRQLLLRLIAIPIAAVALLAGLMVYGFHEVQRNARQVDRSDRIIAQANNLMKLMIDQETGLRGFLLTRDAQFLEPYLNADQQLQPQFASIFRLIKDNPPQIARLQKLQTESQAWQQSAQASIHQPASGTASLAMMVRRKQQMDALRQSADSFLSAEEAIRASRSSIALRIGNLSLALLVGSSAFIGLLLAWIIHRHVRQLTRAYNLQMDEVRRRSEESYAREQWLNTTLRSIGDAVIACDPQGNVVFMNRVAEQLTGWEEKGAHGQPLSTIFPIYNQHTRAVVENPVDKVRRMGSVVGLANHTILVSKNQKEFHIDDSAAPILGANERMIGIVLVFRDITERYAAERALVRTEKLASAGRLAAAIAHEVNNPLEGLVNLVYLARRDDNLATVRRHLEQADGELQRIAHITRQSLGFYRESQAPGLFRPDLVAREVFDFFSFRAANAQVGLHVTVKTEQSAFGNAGELRQVISNLLANSLDACKAGDAICVRVTAARNLRGVAGVRIVVADTGCGIQQKNLKAVFEPFFTTKKDTGTGLGLWVSRELIEKNGGRLTVRSSDRAVRTGTVFSIFLPTAVAAPTEATGAGERLALESSAAKN